MSSLNAHSGYRQQSEGLTFPPAMSKYMFFLIKLQSRGTSGGQPKPRTLQVLSSSEIQEGQRTGCRAQTQLLAKRTSGKSGQAVSALSYKSSLDRRLLSKSGPIITGTLCGQDVKLNNVSVTLKDA